MKPTELFQNLKNLTEADLLEIKGVGEVLAKNIIDFTNSTRFEKLNKKFERLENEQKAPAILETQKGDGELKNTTICITGSFDISRDKIKEALEAKGAKIVNTVSKNTNILLAGEKAGSKLEKAKKLGVRVETKLNQLI